MFILLLALISTTGVSPPSCLNFSPACLNSFITAAGLAPPRSILFIATIIGILLPSARFITSKVYKKFILILDMYIELNIKPYVLKHLKYSFLIHI